MPTNYPAGLQPSEYAEYDAYLASQGGGVTNPPPVAPPATQPDGTQGTYYGFQGNVMPTGENSSFNQEAFNKLPQYLRDQYTQSLGDSEGSYAGPKWQAPGQILKDSSGKIVYQLGPNGETLGNGYKLKDPSKKTWDPDLGWVTDLSNLDSTKWDARHRASGRRAMMIMAAAAGAGAMGVGAGGGGLASGGTVPTIADAGLLSASGIAPEAGALAAAPALAGGGAAGGIAGTGLTLGQIGTGIRTAGSALGLGRALGIGGNSSSGGSSFLNTLAQGIGGYNNAQQDKGTLNDFKQAIKDMIIQGDPYAPKRAEAIRRLGELEANPGSVTANPLFKSMSDKSQEDLSRIYASRGMNVSGNEMGGLQENFLANMNKFYGEEWNRIAKEAGVFVDPSTMASAGIRAAGDVAKGEGNRSAANNALIQRLLGGGGSGGGNDGGIWSILGKLFSDDNSWDWPDGWSSDENFLDGVS